MKRSTGIRQRTIDTVLNKRFGRLMVLELIQVPYGKTKARCICDCGIEITTTVPNLIRGHTMSCGCLQKELTISRSTIHGQCGTGTYHSWASMKKRMTNKNCKDYKHYGGRGLKMQEDWNEYVNFLRDMGPKPEGLELERVDNEIGYFKKNCVWATHREEMANTRRNVYFIIDGIRKHQSEWCRVFKMSVATFVRRIKAKWDVKKALTTPAAMTGIKCRPNYPGLSSI